VFVSVCVSGVFLTLGLLHIYTFDIDARVFVSKNTGKKPLKNAKSCRV